MKKIISLAVIILGSLLFISCSDEPGSAGTKSSNAVKDSVNVNSIIIDVRTPEEWNQDGHANCSVNYPLDELESKIDQLHKYDRIVVVCRSGSRANAAKDMLEKAGFKDVENKGSWQNISCK